MLVVFISDNNGGGPCAVRCSACALSCSSSPCRARVAWSWPVDGPVLQPFSFDRAHPYAAGQHRGIDIGARAGASVVAPAAGVVSFAGTTPGNGLTLSIRTVDGYTSRSRTSARSPSATGATVAEGDPSATVGADGDAELDAAVRPPRRSGSTDDENGYVDPLSLLPVRAVGAAAASPTATRRPPCDSGAEPARRRSRLPAAAAPAVLPALPTTRPPMPASCRGERAPRRRLADAAPGSRDGRRSGRPRIQPRSPTAPPEAAPTIESPRRAAEIAAPASPLRLERSLPRRRTSPRLARPAGADPRRRRGASRRAVDPSLARAQVRSRYALRRPRRLVPPPRGSQPETRAPPADLRRAGGRGTDPRSGPRVPWLALAGAFVVVGGLRRSPEAFAPGAYH